MIYNNKEYDHICIGFMPDDLDWIDWLSQYSAWDVSAWLRTILLLLSRNNRMPYAELTRIVCSHSVTQKMISAFLDQTGCFCTDDSGTYISCTPQCMECFLRINNDSSQGCSSLPRYPRRDERPTEDARTPANTEQEKRNIKRKKNKSSFAELSSNAATPEEKEFYQMLFDNCPRVCQMEEPLTYYEYQRIVRQGIPLATIREVLQAMQNHRDLLRKYVSANLTLRHWIAIRQA